MGLPCTHKRIEMKHLIAIIILALSVTLSTSAQEATEDTPKALRFAWGADLNSSVDLSQNDMTNIGIDAYFGISLPAVEMLGVGVGANVPVSNSRYSYPIFAILRTNFKTRPTPLLPRLASRHIGKQPHRFTPTDRCLYQRRRGYPACIHALVPVAPYPGLHFHLARRFYHDSQRRQRFGASRSRPALCHPAPRHHILIRL